MKGLLALALAYVLSQFYRSFLAVLTPQLTAELGADKGDLSLASGLWFVAFGIMQFVVGVSLDRYGPRRTAAYIFGVSATSGALLFASAQSPLAIVIAMALFGIGCSPVLMASLFIFARRFESRQFAVLTSSLVAFGSLGNVVGASPLASAVDAFGWREVMFALAAISALAAILVGLLVDDPSVSEPENAGLSGYLELLRSPVLWAILIMSLMCYAPVAGIRGLWAGPYLSDLYHSTGLEIGRVTLYMALAMITGSLLYGPLDRLFNTRKWIVFTGNCVVLAALLVLSWQPTQTIPVATILLVIIGLCGSSYGVLMAHGKAFLPAQLTGRGVTLINFCSIAGAGAMQFVTGRVVNSQGDPSAPGSYQLLFIAYAIALAVALLIYLCSKDAKLKEE